MLDIKPPRITARTKHKDNAKLPRQRHMAHHFVGETHIQGTRGRDDRHEGQHKGGHSQHFATFLHQADPHASSSSKTPAKDSPRQRKGVAGRSVPVKQRRAEAVHTKAVAPLVEKKSHEGDDTSTRLDLSLTLFSFLQGNALFNDSGHMQQADMAHKIQAWTSVEKMHPREAAFISKIASLLSRDEKRGGKFALAGIAQLFQGMAKDPHVATMAKEMVAELQNFVSESGKADKHIEALARRMRDDVKALLAKSEEKDKQSGPLGKSDQFLVEDEKKLKADLALPKKVHVEVDASAPARKAMAAHGSRRHLTQKQEEALHMIARAVKTGQVKTMRVSQMSTSSRFAPLSHSVPKADGPKKRTDGFTTPQDSEISGGDPLRTRAGFLGQALHKEGTRQEGHENFKEDNLVGTKAEKELTGQLKGANEGQDFLSLITQQAEKIDVKPSVSEAKPVHEIVHEALDFYMSSPVHEDGQTLSMTVMSADKKPVGVQFENIGSGSVGILLQPADAEMAHHLSGTRTQLLAALDASHINLDNIQVKIAPVNDSASTQMGGQQQGSFDGNAAMMNQFSSGQQSSSFGHAQGFTPPPLPDLDNDEMREDMPEEKTAPRGGDGGKYGINITV